METPKNAARTSTTVKDFVKLALGHLGVSLEFNGKGLDDKAFVTDFSQDIYHLSMGIVVLNVYPKYFRRTEKEFLIGNTSKGKQKLGWVPVCKPKDIVEDMMENDLILTTKERCLKNSGYITMYYFE